MDTTRVSLLERIRNLQDRESWEEFVETYGPFLLRVLRRHGIVRDDALDLVQETFRAVAANIGDFEYDPEKSFRKYLATIALRQAWRFLRERGRRPVARGGTTHCLAVQQVSGEIVDEEWYRGRLEKAIQQSRLHLSEMENRVFQLADLEGLPDRQVAEQLGIDIGYEYVCKSRARKKIRELVEQGDE